jgi:hypothetical protein
VTCTDTGRLEGLATAHNDLNNRQPGLKA